MPLSGLDIPSPSRSTKDIIDKTCPDPSEIKVAREFLFSFGAQNDFTQSGYSRRLQKVVNWMQVNSYILCRRNWHSRRGRQTLTLRPGLWDNIKLLSMSLTITGVLRAVSLTTISGGMYTRRLGAQSLTIGYENHSWNRGLRLSFTNVSPSNLRRY